MHVYRRAIVLSLVALAFYIPSSEPSLLPAFGGVDDVLKVLPKLGDDVAETAIGTAVTGRTGGVVHGSTLEVLTSPEALARMKLRVPEGFTLKPGSADSVNLQVPKPYKDEEVTAMARAQLRDTRAAKFKETTCLLKGLATTLATDVGKEAYNRAVRAVGSGEAYELSPCLNDQACMACSRLSDQITCDGGSMITSMTAGKVGMPRAAENG